MEANPIAFVEIHERMKTGIIGGILEILRNDTIIRGTIKDIIWWPHLHPRRIDWTDENIWDPRFALWDRGNDAALHFDFTESECFTGPYEMKSREIIFFPPKVNYVTIFPTGHEPGDVPYDWQACLNLHCQIMGQKPPGRLPT
jgi:hypothetical protein